MQDDPNPVKDYLFDYLAKSDEKIQKLISDKKFSEIIEDVITNCYDKIITIGKKDESIGVLATGLLHFLLTNALLTSQRKIEYQVLVIKLTKRSVFLAVFCVVQLISAQFLSSHLFLEYI